MHTCAETDSGIRDRKERAPPETGERKTWQAFSARNTGKEWKMDRDCFRVMRLFSCDSIPVSGLKTVWN